MASYLAPIVSLAINLRGTTPFGNKKHENDHEHIGEVREGAVPADDFVEFLIWENVKQQVRNITESAMIQEAWARGSRGTLLIVD